MKSIPTTVIGHLPQAKCSFTGKDKVECFVVRVGNGEPQNVSVARLIEVLRWNCSIAFNSAVPPALTKSEEK